MEPCATYRILADYDYSQSLVSKELYTTDTDNVMLRFNLRNKRIQDNYRNYLEIEISADKVNWSNVYELVSLQFITLVTDYRHYVLSSCLDINSF